MLYAKSGRDGGRWLRLGVERKSLTYTSEDGWYFHFFIYNMALPYISLISLSLSITHVRKLGLVLSAGNSKNYITPGQTEAFQCAETSFHGE